MALLGTAYPVAGRLLMPVWLPAHFFLIWGTLGRTHLQSVATTVATSCESVELWASDPCLSQLLIMQTDYRRRCTCCVYVTSLIILILAFSFQGFCLGIPVAGEREKGGCLSRVMWSSQLGRTLSIPSHFTTWVAQLDPVSGADTPLDFPFVQGNQDTPFS